MDYPEIMARLGASVLIGGVIGLDRNLRGKPSGIRTLGLVSLGSCLLTMAGMNFLSPQEQTDWASASRIIQGLITGIGFLGSGVITQGGDGERIRGLTTAASIWITAILGVLCGMGSWQVACIALFIVFLLFVAGKPLERAAHKRWLDKPADEKQEMSLHDE